MVQGNENYNSTEAQKITATIEKAPKSSSASVVVSSSCEEVESSSSEAPTPAWNRKECRRIKGCFRPKRTDANDCCRLRTQDIHLRHAGLPQEGIPRIFQRKPQPLAESNEPRLVHHTSDSGKLRADAPHQCPVKLRPQQLPQFKQTRHNGGPSL